MIAVIDNYDSFTFNLVQYLAEMGKRIVVIRNDEVTADEVLAMRPEYIVISPGPGRPVDAGMSIELIQKAAALVPILGVCLGHQAIGEAFGGTIVHAGILMHGKTSSIHHDSSTIYQGLPNPFTATRYHSLIIERETLPECLEITAETSDGLIMGVRHKELPIEGVQFHPESILTREGKQLLRNFIGINQSARATVG